jgi:hypothetical protein
MAAAVANKQQRLSALPAEFVISRIFNMAIWTIHFWFFSPQHRSC